MYERIVLQGMIDGFFTAPRVVELHVHDDGTLSGSATACQQDDFETFLLVDGCASVVDDDGSCFTVRFQLAKRTDLPGVIYVVDVEGTLSTSTGLCGQWRFAASASATTANADAAIEEGRAFTLPVQQRDPYTQSKAKTVSSLYPLTQGSYTVSGATIGDNGYLYQATWHLELLPGGVLQGASTERDNVPQISRLDGTWSFSQIRCALYYVVNGVTGTYIYEGDAYQAAIRGRCVNPAAPKSSHNERGSFEFGVVSARRRWNHSDHKYYPTEFRDVVKTCLVSSASTSRTTASSNRLSIPSPLWSDVFSYCGYDWFTASA